MTHTKPIVFVTQWVKNLKYEDAERFGEVQFLTDQDFAPSPASHEFNDRVTSEMRKNFSQYIAGTDYILLTGSSLPNMIIGGIIAESGHNIKHNVLKWDNRKHRYELYKVRI